MSISGLIIGIVTALGFIISNYGFGIFDWFNWLNMAFAFLGFILSMSGTIQKTNLIIGITGILLCGSIIALSCISLF
jgi:hypothetical protein